MWPETTDYQAQISNHNSLDPIEHHSPKTHEGIVGQAGGNARRSAGGAHPTAAARTVAPSFCLGFLCPLNPLWQLIPLTSCGKRLVLCFRLLLVDLCLAAARVPLSFFPSDLLTFCGLGGGVDLPAAFGGPFFGEVQVGKFAEVLNGGKVVGPRRLDFTFAKAEPDVFARDGDFRIPLLVSLSVPDAFVLRDGGDTFGTVPRVFIGSAGTQIDPAVVQFVAVHVVDHLAFRRAHDLAVHVDRPSLLPPAGVPVLQTPIVLAEPLVVGGVHVGVQAVAERDSFDVAFGRGGLGAVVAAGLGEGDRLHQAGRVGVVGADRPAGKA
jgi:hypothetical protein